MANKDMTVMLGIQGYSVAQVTHEQDKVIVDLKKEDHSYRCGRCGRTSFIYYDRRRVVVEDLTIWGKRSFLRFYKHRIRCEHCRKVVTEAVDFVAPNRRYTKRFESFIGYLCKEMTVKAVSELTGFHWDTVRDIDKRYIQAHIAAIDWKQITQLSIDEVSYRRRHKYFTILSDHRSGRTVKILEGRKSKVVSKFFKSLAPEVRLQIELVTMDKGESL